MLGRLNKEYQGLVEMSLNVESIYQYMVETENYRMLAHFEYNKDETPLRSKRVSEAPPLTDVSRVFICSLYLSIYLSIFVDIFFI